MVQRRGAQQAVNGRHGAAFRGPGVSSGNDQSLDTFANFIQRQDAQKQGVIRRDDKPIQHGGIRGGAPVPGRGGCQSDINKSHIQERIGAGTGWRHFLHEIPTHRLSPTLARVTETVWPHAPQPGP